MMKSFFLFNLCGAIGATDSFDDDGPNLLQTRIVQEVGFNFDANRWSQRDGYYVLQQHGATNECYPTLEEAQAKCDAAGDCHAVATQSNVCSGGFRVSHGGPTLAYWSTWQAYQLRCWVMTKTVAEAVTTTTTITTTTTTGCPEIGICVSSASCGTQDATDVVKIDCQGKSACAVTVTDGNSGGSSGGAIGSGVWEQKDGYYVGEQHGATNECYPTLEEAEAKCIAAGDCHAVATQSNVCSGGFRVSHGGPTFHYWSTWQAYQLRAWHLTSKVSLVADEDFELVTSALRTGHENLFPSPMITDEDEDELLKPPPTSLIALSFDFDANRWSQRDGYYVSQQHGATNECYPTLEEAQAKCDAAGDCHAVATQSNVCGGGFRVSHGGPTLAYWSTWQAYQLRCWVMTKTVAEATPAGPPGCKEDYTIEYTCNTAAKKFTASLKKPSAGQTAKLSCPAFTGVTTTTSTSIPGGNTNPGGKDCFAAIATWGPDFDCNDHTVSFCGDDSGDGMDVALCCQDYCGTNKEKQSKKKEVEGATKQAEGDRKSQREESRSKRKVAESERKKTKKQDEWLAKRGAQEAKNKNVEDERKTKNGFSASKKKNERSWKGNRAVEKKVAQRRESARKVNRAEGEKKNKMTEKTSKNGGKRAKKREKSTKRKAARKEKKSKRGKGRKGRKGTR